MNEFWGWLGEQLGNVLGVLGLIAGAWFYWLSRKPKRFGWEVVSKTEIISSRGRGLPLTVVYDGRDVSSPNVVVLRIGNVGKAEMRASDFDGPVVVNFNSSKLLAATVTRKFDDAIALTDVVVEGNQLSFDPPLLNAGDWVEIQFVTDGPLEEPKVHARVAGQNGPSLDVANTRKRTWGPVLWVAIVLACISPLSILFIFGKDWGWLGIGMSGLGIAMIFVGSNRVDSSATWAKKRRPGKRKKK